MDRRLAAILSADVQGYSLLMGEDEEATVRTLTTYLEVIGSFVHQNQGRVVDSPGDNLLAEFTSVVHAVQCALAVQQELNARNQALPESRKMLFRIGVNLGDILVDGDRIYGDGVNITARIERLAEGGGICISGPAYDQVKNKLALGYVFLGEHTVKNIRDPVRVYCVRPKPEVATAGACPASSSRKHPWRWKSTGKKPLLLITACLLLFLISVAIKRHWSPPSQGFSQLLETAYQALARGEWSQAEASFQRLGSLTGKQVKGHAYAGLAAVAFARGNIQQALERAARAEQLDPELIYSHVIRGHILLVQGNITEATQAYRTATNKTSGTPWQKAIAFNRLGRIYATRGFFGTALKYYNLAIEQHPDKAMVLANKAHLIEESGKRQEALTLYRRALQMRPNDPLITTLLLETERRQKVAQNLEEQAQRNRWVAERLRAYQENQNAQNPKDDSWTSTPLTLTFLPLQRHGSFAQRAGEGEYFALHVLQALRESGRLTLIEQERLALLLSELRLSILDLSDSETALRVGKILGARLIATGSIVRDGMQEKVGLRLIETATNEVRVQAETIWAPDGLDGVAQRLSRDLLQQVRQVYPLRGQIRNITPQNTLLLNLGIETGVTPGTRMLVMGPDSPVGKVEVIKVTPQYSQAKVLQQTAAFQVSWKVQEEQ